MSTTIMTKFLSREKLLENMALAIVLCMGLCYNDAEKSNRHYTEAGRHED